MRARKNFDSLLRRSTLGLREHVRLGLEEDRARVSAATAKAEAAKLTTAEHAEQEDWK